MLKEKKLHVRVVKVLNKLLKYDFPSAGNESNSTLKEKLEARLHG